MSSISLIEYFGNGMYRYIDCDGIEHILREPVKCEDCKHKCVKGKTTQYHYCEIWKSAIDETDFCSRGEKK